MCGYKSRSTLHDLRAKGLLAAYLAPDGKGLLTDPPGLPPLAEHVKRSVRLSVRSPGSKPERERRPLDPRWEVAASLLSEALEPVTGLTLTGREAHAIAEAVPDVVAAAFGVEPPGNPAESTDPLIYHREVALEPRELEGEAWSAAVTGWVDWMADGPDWRRLHPADLLWHLSDGVAAANEGLAPDPLKIRREEVLGLIDAATAPACEDRALDSLRARVVADSVARLRVLEEAGEIPADLDAEVTALLW